MPANSIPTRTGMICVDTHGIVHVRFNPGAEETLADAQACVSSVLSLFDGETRPLLVDMRLLKSLERDARNYYGSPEVMCHTTALALLVGSRVSTVIANFFLSVTKSSVPTRLFTDEAQAIEWLKGFPA